MRSRKDSQIILRCRRNGIDNHIDRWMRVKKTTTGSHEKHRKRERERMKKHLQLSAGWVSVDSFAHTQAGHALGQVAAGHRSYSLQTHWVLFLFWSARGFRHRIWCKESWMEIYILYVRIFINGADSIVCHAADDVALTCFSFSRSLAMNAMKRYPPPSRPLCVIFFVYFGFQIEMNRLIMCTYTCYECSAHLSKCYGRRKWSRFNANQFHQILSHWRREKCILMSCQLIKSAAT